MFINFDEIITIMNVLVCRSERTIMICGEVAIMSDCGNIHNDVVIKTMTMMQ